ncbi:ABC transporter substrate-binding protein [Tropicimonas sp. IMCC6043]|uniref:ABC transporter substrate-binding protein n=1 Tax=Tropicimonas sp. IMCC6043 TaxID=2510645 RepID=UPI00101C3946|nr:ABC transporter substrate-binding protein [Tropicimonas sp. IMCC6043]RYH12389.1 hypothetical protein EU800_02185 [Tropicimonas sp. IMCC6043]
MKTAIKPFRPLGLLRGVCLAGLLACLATVTAAQSIDAQAAALAGQFDALSRRSDLDTTERAREFLGIMERGFDLDHMARQALGPDAEPDPDQWQDYRRAYRAHLFHGHLKSLELGPSRSEVLGHRPAAGGGEVIGLSVRAGSRVSQVVWLTCPEPGFRICDVEVDGMRLSVWSRDSFAPALARLGWRGFLESLRRGDLVELR